MNNEHYLPLARTLESPVSIISRFIHHNGYSTAVHFCQLNKLKISELYTLTQGSLIFRYIMQQDAYTSKQKTKLAECFFESLSPGRSGHLRFMSSDIHCRLLRKHSNFCPSCIRSGYLDITHCFKFSTACHIHGDTYIDKCPRCHKDLSWIALNNYTCPCGCDLRECHTPSGNKEPNILIANAILQDNTYFFHKLKLSLNIFKKFYPKQETSKTSEYCIYISENTQKYLPNIICEMQEEFPSLHRRALLAPWVYSNNADFRTAANNYYLNNPQEKPDNHKSTCTCRNLNFTPIQLRYALNLSKSLPLEINDKIQASNQKKTLLYAKNLCSLLINSPQLQWSPNQKGLTSNSATDYATVSEAAKYLSVPPLTIGCMCLYKIIDSTTLYYSKHPVIKLSDLRNFKDSYIFNTHIASKFCTGLQTAYKIMLRLGATAVKFDKRQKFIIYKKDSIPKNILALIEEIKTEQQASTDRSYESHAAVAERLSLHPKSISSLLELGVLKLCTTHNANDKEGRTYCSKDSISEAIKWRKQHLTLVEAAKLLKCSSASIKHRYIDTAYVPAIRLKGTILIKKTDATKIKNHLAKYIIKGFIYAEYKLSNSITKGLIKDQSIPVLSTDHKDALAGYEIVRRSDITKITPLKR